MYAWSVLNASSAFKMLRQIKTFLWVEVAQQFEKDLQQIFFSTPI